MASLVINTAVESHPRISIDQIDLAREQITFRWIGGPYSGDCSEPFTLSLVDHGDMTISQMADAITAAMVAKLPTQEQ